MEREAEFFAPLRLYFTMLLAQVLFIPFEFPVTMVSFSSNTLVWYKSGPWAGHVEATTFRSVYSFHFTKRHRSTAQNRRMKLTQILLPGPRPADLRCVSQRCSLPHVACAVPSIDAANEGGGDGRCCD